MLALRYPLLWWAPGCLLVAGVVAGSLMPAASVPGFALSDKLMHAGAYGLLMLWFVGLVARRRHWLVALCLCALGFALDLAQGAMPSRSFDLADVAANAGGILLGLVLGRSVLEGWCQRLEQRLFA